MEMHFNDKNDTIQIVIDLSVSQMMESQVSHCQHSAVRLQFFETAVRFDRFFTHHTHFIPELLASSSFPKTLNVTYVMHILVASLVYKSSL